MVLGKARKLNGDGEQMLISSVKEYKMGQRLTSIFRKSNGYNGLSANSLGPY
jgi:hypothetical protein